MTGKLLRRIVIWPIPPAYSGPALATVVLTAVIVGAAQVHTLPGVLAALLGATAAVAAAQSLCGKRRSAE